MRFEFKAFTRDGKLKEGVISADTKDAAIKLLQEQGLLITQLTEKKGSAIFYQKVKIKDVYIFNRQLSYLIKAKTPLDESIKSLSETTPNPKFRAILIEIYNDLISGIPFSTSISRFPEIFDSYYVGMVKVGESVGALEEVLNYLANHLESRMKFRNRLMQASLYPAVVVFLFIGIMIALFYFIVPQISKIFIENNIPMPWITSIFKSFSEFLVNFGIVLVIIFAFLIYYIYDYFKTREGRVTLFNIVDGLPIFGPLIKNMYSFQFLDSLYYLQKGGVPILESLKIIKSTMAHPFYESALEYIIEDVRKGRPLSESLSQFPDLFSNLVIEGMKTAEKTGQLGDITFTLANFYNESVESQLGNLSEALQPILIIFIGAGLGLLEASLLIPLLSLTKHVQNF